MFLRRSLPADDEAVYALHAAAFARALEADLFATLRRDGSLVDDLCFVAAADGRIVGSVVTSVASVGPARVVAVGPVGVVPSWQRRGAGTALMHALVGAADALHEQCVVLLGSTGYYGRFGFGPAAPIEAPDPEWGEHFQVRRLTAWDGTLAGPFRYAPAFG